MKKAIFALLFLTLLGMIGAQAQTVSEPIEILEKGIFKKKVYKKCEIEMEPTQLIKLFQNDPAMKDYVKPIAGNYLISKLLSATAVVLVSYPLLNSLSDDHDPNWNLAYIAAGCAVASIPFQKWFEKNADEAVAYYNSGYQARTDYQPTLNVQIGNHGLGLAFKF
ncbi:hypothetical protein IFO69_12245 [Echinicola sp. CAU 1574]|uniref:Uncharacterized protein n=1 Tax=Echinicola arenosa TaxID=2774144 RepID=A0ABR9AL86_9BACT|nr:hypothetical protein [Echinicola arenosa]MBD8489517.1 hypothetical protein [Echinicola arenosa]